MTAAGDGKGFADDDILVLSPEWHVRPNRGEAVLYEFKKDASNHLELPAFESVAITLFDGSASLGTVRRRLSDLLDLEQAEAAAVIQNLLECNRDLGPFLFPLAGLVGRFTRVNTMRMLLDMVAYVPSPVRARRLQAPLSLMVIPTYKCYADCIYCYAERPPLSSSAYLSPDRWVAVLTEAGELGIDLLTFSGGDPLMYPGFERLLEVAARYQMNYVVPTKTPITPSRAERLARYLCGGAQIQVSVDSFDPVVAARMTRTPDYSERAKASIRNLRAAGLPVQTNTVVTPLNLDTIESLLRELHGLGVADAHLTNYYRTHYRHDDALFLSAAQIDRLNEAVARLKEELNWPGLVCSASVRDFSVPGSNTEVAWRGRVRCSGGSSSCVILPNGDIVLCEQVPHEAPFVVGNVARQSIVEVWDSQELMDFIVPERRLFEGTACYDCDEFDSCHREHGRCFRDALFHYGRLHAPSPNCPRAALGLRFG